MSVELARSMNYYAAMCIADGRLDPVVAAPPAADRALGRHIAQEAIQMRAVSASPPVPVAHYAAPDQDRADAGLLDRPVAFPVRQVGA